MWCLRKKKIYFRIILKKMFKYFYVQSHINIIESNYNCISLYDLVVRLTTNTQTVSYSKFFIPEGNRNLSKNSFVQHTTIKYRYLCLSVTDAKRSAWTLIKCCLFIFFKGESTLKAVVGKDACVWGDKDKISWER